MAQQVTFKLTVDNKGIVTGSRQATKEVKAVDKATDSAQKRTGALTRAWRRFGGVVSAIAVGALIQRTFRRAMNAGREFESQLADLEAITGITGDALDLLGDAAMETSSRYGVAATEIVEAQKLVASQLAEKIDFGTEEGIRELRDVADQAVLLQKAAGIDLSTAVEATTTALNQFNLEASETNRVINTIAAGSKLGAAETRDQAEAYREAGTAFAGAGQTIESLNASVQVLAANAIRGSRAGTGLRNIITRLETRADRLAEHGFDNLNLKSDGFAVTMEKLAPLLDDVSARTDIFGEQAQGLAAILIQNAEGLQDMETAVTETDTAMEQAEVKMQTFDSAVERLSNTFDNRLIKSFQATNGVGVKFINMITSAVDSVGEAIDNVNHWMESHKDLRREQELAETQIRATIRTSKDSIEQIQEEIKARDLQGESLKEAEDAIADLRERYTSILPEFEAYEEDLRRQVKEQEEVIESTKEMDNSMGQRDVALRQAQEELERLNIRLANAGKAQDVYREEVNKGTKAQKDQAAAVNENAKANENLKDKISDRKDEMEALLLKDGELTDSEMERLRRLEAERRELTKIVEQRERLLELQVDAMEKMTEQNAVEGKVITNTEDHAAALAKRNVEGSKTVTVSRSVTGSLESEGKQQSENAKRAEEAAVRIASSAAIRANSMGEAAKAAIDAIFAEVVAIAIKKAMSSVPFPFNIAAAGGAALAAKGLRSLIPEFADGGTPTGAMGMSGMTTPGKKFISINERKNPEFIINDRSTREALPLLERINSSPEEARAVSRQVQGFARGGLVSGADVPQGRSGNAGEIAGAIREAMKSVTVVASVSIDRIHERLERHEEFLKSIGN